MYCVKIRPKGWIFVGDHWYNMLMNNELSNNMVASNNQMESRGQITASTRRLRIVLTSLVAIAIIEMAMIILIPILRPSGETKNTSSEQGGASQAGQDIEVREANTMDEITEICKTYNLYPTIDVGEGTEHITESIECDDFNNGALFVSFSVFDQPLMELVDIDNNASSDVVILERTQDYGKFHSWLIEGVSGYVIVSDNTALGVFGDENMVRQVIIDLGWPDRNWVDDSEADDGLFTKDSMESATRDSERLNIIDDVVTLMTMYQANNRNRIPAGPYYWPNTNGSTCVDRQNEACAFIETYLYAQEVDGFTDPDGSQFGVYYTDNWYDNGDINPYFGNDNSRLVGDVEGYTIGGNSPFGEHIIYIIPGSLCNNYS